MNVQLSFNSEHKSYLEIVREKVAYYGEQHVGISEALALVIGKSSDSESCLKLSSLSVREILNLTQADLKEMGFSNVIAERLFACILFSKKLNAMSLPERFVIRTPEDAYQAVKYLQHYEQEVFTVLALDTKNNVLGKKEVFIGSLDRAVVHPREVFRFALQKGAAGIVVAHNHPSGSPKESREDCEVTMRLVDAGRHIGIDLLDHIIVGNDSYLSLKEKGVI
jgi:DNA repair protein RadC